MCITEYGNTSRTEFRCTSLGVRSLSEQLKYPNQTGKLMGHTKREIGKERKGTTQYRSRVAGIVRRKLLLISRLNTAQNNDVFLWHIFVIICLLKNNSPLGLYPGGGRWARLPCITCRVLSSAKSAVDFLPLQRESWHKIAKKSGENGNWKHVEK
jgi:hypothetical protein